MLDWTESTTIKIIALYKYKGIEFDTIFTTIFNIIKKGIGVDPVQWIEEMRKNRIKGLNAAQKAAFNSLPLLFWICEENKLKSSFNQALDHVLITEGIDIASVQMDLYYEYLNPSDEMKKEKYLAQGYKRKR